MSFFVLHSVFFFNLYVFTCSVIDTDIFLKDEREREKVDATYTGFILQCPDINTVCRSGTVLTSPCAQKNIVPLWRTVSCC